MKKKWLIPVALLLTAGLMLAGCNGDPEPGGPGPGPGPGDTAVIDYRVIPSNGIEHTENTTILLFSFFTVDEDGKEEDAVIETGGLAMDDISITDGTGSIEMVSLQDTRAPSRMLTINVIEEGSVTVKISKTGFSAEEKTANVYKDIGFVIIEDGDISEVVQFGKPTEGENVTFGEYQGATTAVLPPETYEPVTTLDGSLNQVLATFDPPFDLTTTAEQDFRWFDMVWQGLGSTWDYDDGDGNVETLALHHVTFVLELTTSADVTITFQKQTELSTSTAGLKVPVRFLKGDITAGDWGTGHSIKSITLRIIGVGGQLRDLENNRWPNISATYPVTLEDLLIVSLSVDALPPSAPLVLYTQADGWNEDIISNPCWGFGDAAFTTGGRNELFEDDGEDPPTVTLLPIPQLTGLTGEQKIIYFDPIDLIDLADKAPYSTIVVTHTGGNLGYWNGQGIISVNPEWVEIANDGRVKLQMFGGGGGSPLRLALNPDSYDGFDNYWNPETFMGFFLQWNSGNATITEIRVE